ncbi:MAG TPA: glycosyltransferase [Acidimicrobiales bacterium]|nr:glycosyltransferase [Acidimicrobiales bacterium]
MLGRAVEEGPGERRVRLVAHHPQPAEQARAEALDLAIHGLERTRPEMSARRTLVGWQRSAMAVTAGVLALGFALRPVLTGSILISLLVALYVATMVERSVVFARGLRAVEFLIRRPLPPMSDEELPRYTILVPAYREAEVVGHLVDALGALDYPPDRLEVLLLVEDDDDLTISALLPLELPPFARVLLVPASEPRTKPKACNYGLHFASGELVTIFDAEDRPEPMQLRCAVDAFRRAGPRTVCLQARLQYFNARQNMLTRWFTVDYTTWFAVFLPGLASFGLPVPLGGTSNHIRAEALVAVGGWDPYNVTEDADLGIRLVRAGLRTGIIDSVTYEEANSDGLNWVRQRSRWYKGYMQTWLVHVRQPVRMLRELGPHGFLSVTLLTGATPLLSAVNLLSWTCTIVFIIGTPGWLVQVFPAPVVYFGTAAAFFGNATVVYVSLIACRQTHQGHLAWAALTYPLYWVLMAVAGVKSLWQLVARPSYWEKTVHGLARSGPD